MRILRTLKYFIIIMTALLLTACGLPSDVKKQTDEIPGRIEAVGTEISGKKDKYTKLKGSDQFKFFAPYAKREKWDAFFVEADNELKRAKSHFDSKVMPIRERNKEDDATAILIQLAQVNRIIASAIKSSKKAAARMGFLEAVKKEAPKMVKTADGEVVKCGEIIESLDGFIAGAKTEYPKKTEDITGRYAPLNKLHKDAQSALIITHAEFKLHESGKAADYAKLGDGTVLAADNLNKLTSLDKSLRLKVGELFRSYSKVIIDMKVIEKPWKQVVRYEWSNWAEYDDTSVTSNNKVFVSMEEFKRLQPRFSSSNEALVVDTGGSHETCIEDMDIDYHYSHKYLLIENKEQKKTDWVVVSEKFYENNEDNLGMEIVSKPYGVYEEEALKKAAPPGMANVGNPKYGKWVTNSSGQRQWGWFEHYMFYNLMFGGSSRNYYSYNDWNSWNNNYRSREPYYGRDAKGRQKYGTAGSTVRTSTKYNKTNFAKTGGFKRANASVRGAGPGNRGGGPGGKGK